VKAAGQLLLKGYSQRLEQFASGIAALGRHSEQSEESLYSAGKVYGASGRRQGSFSFDFAPGHDGRSEDGS
jgi:hypothetical protein